jgi:hypothetical protein
MKTTDIPALQAHALKLYEADNCHAKELGYALLKVRAALKHGDFKKWRLENKLSQARVSYCMRLASGKVAAAKAKQRSPFQGVLVKEVKKDMNDFLRFASSPQASSVEVVYSRFALFIGRLILDIGRMQGWHETNIRGPLVEHANKAMSTALHGLLVSTFAKDESQEHDVVASLSEQKPAQVNATA